MIYFSREPTLVGKKIVIAKTSLYLMNKLEFFDAVFNIMILWKFSTGKQNKAAI